MDSHVDNSSHQIPSRQATPQSRTRVHGVNVDPVEAATFILKVPPRHTVDRRNYNRIWSYQRQNLGDEIGERAGFHTEKHNVLNTEVRAIVRAHSHFYSSPCVG